MGWFGGEKSNIQKQRDMLDSREDIGKTVKHLGRSIRDFGKGKGTESPKK